MANEALPQRSPHVEPIEGGEQLVVHLWLGSPERRGPYAKTRFMAKLRAPLAVAPVVSNPSVT
jgi:hypothetical protein